jgi:hypothetical protein
MSAWRRKAIACMPEESVEFARKDTTIYQVFFALLPATVRAHQQNDNVKLRNYYDFAEWCFTQKSKDLWNAAGVCFYAHLGDKEATSQAMPKWVKKNIYVQVRGLLVLRLDEDRVKQLDRLYSTC